MRAACLVVGVDHGENVHIAAGLFGQVTAVVHAAEVDDEGLFRDLVRLCTGEQAGSHAVQCGQTLLRPDTAHGQRGAEQDGQHPGHDGTAAGGEALAHQQPEQHQKRSVITR